MNTQDLYQLKMKRTIYIRTEEGTINVQDVRYVKCVRNKGSYADLFKIGAVYAVEKIKDEPYLSSSGCNYHSLLVLDDSGNAKSISGGFHYSLETLEKSGIAYGPHTGFIPHIEPPYELF